MVGPYEREVKKFVKAAFWLSDTDDLTLHHLKVIAKTLDGQLDKDGLIQAATGAQFRLTMNDLYDRKPKVEINKEEDDDDIEFS